LAKRHLSSKGLSQSEYLISMFINLAVKGCLGNEGNNASQSKDVLATLNRKSLDLKSYFNLGIFLKKVKEFDKAEAVFKEILEVIKA